MKFRSFRGDIGRTYLQTSGRNDIFQPCQVCTVVTVTNDNVASNLFQRCQCRYVSDFFCLFRIRADNQVPFDNGCFGCGKRSYLLGGLQLHISVRFYLAFHDLIGIFAGISVIGCHPEGSFVIPVRYRFRIRYDCCRSCVLEFHFGIVQRYRIGNGYCYCIVRNVGRVRFPVHGHHDRCDEIFICIFRYNFIVFVTRSQKEQG